MLTCQCYVTVYIYPRFSHLKSLSSYFRLQVSSTLPYVYYSFLLRTSAIQSLTQTHLSQGSPHLKRIILNPPEMNPLCVLNHQPHNASSLVRFQLPCFEFLLLSILGSLADSGSGGCAGNEAPERLSAKPSLHVTIPSVEVVGVEFVKEWN